MCKALSYRQKSNMRVRVKKGKEVGVKTDLSLSFLKRSVFVTRCWCLKGPASCSFLIVNKRERLKRGWL